MAQFFHSTVKEMLDQRLREVEEYFNADVIFYSGQIIHPLIKLFREQLERLNLNREDGKRLVLILGTPGGSAEVVEKLVELIRFYYSEVYFVVPDEAMSAGTIFCMSGNKIYMDYTSSLGPIDPQIWNGKDFVPARGYLDEIEKMLKKATDGTITNAELLIWQSQDLAMLNVCEQQSNLTVTLLKDWLVKYKFNDWQIHSTNPQKIGQPVTLQEKVERAEKIAKELGNNKK